MTRRLEQDEKLRDLLKQGDPAADGRELGRDETATWRRTMLQAADRAGGRRMPLAFLPGPRPAAVAAVLILVAALMLLVGRGSGPGDEPGPTAARTRPPAARENAPAGETPGGTPPASPAPTLRRIAETPAADGTLTPGDSDGSPATSPLVADAGSPAGVPKDEGTLSPAAATVTDARPARTVQFRTAGGTRVIWTLDPGFGVTDS